MPFIPANEDGYEAQLEEYRDKRHLFIGLLFKIFLTTGEKTQNAVVQQADSLHGPDSRILYAGLPSCVGTRNEIWNLLMARCYAILGRWV